MTGSGIGSLTSAVSGASATGLDLETLNLRVAGDRSQGPKSTSREAFQDFVAGTFFQQMLKSMRSTEQELPYIGGGQAEKVFRQQLDQQIAGDLAKSHGAAFADSLYEVFASRLDQSA